MPRICSKCGEEFDDEKISGLCADCRSKIGRSSKRKGAANELRFAKKLQAQFDKHELNYVVRRTPRSGSIHGFEPSDLLFSHLPHDSVFKKHWELKNSHSWSIEDWYKKAQDIEKEVGTHRSPVLVIRKPGSSQTYVVISDDDYIALLIENELLRSNINE